MLILTIVYSVHKTLYFEYQVQKKLNVIEFNNKYEDQQSLQFAIYLINNNIVCEFL